MKKHIVSFPEQETKHIVFPVPPAEAFTKGLRTFEVNADDPLLAKIKLLRELQEEIDANLQTKWEEKGGLPQHR